MKIYRDPSRFISGFFYEDPVAGLPSLTHCGEALCFPGHRLDTHQHHGFEFLYLSRGAIEWQVGGGKSEQSEGTLVVFYPGEPHRTAKPARQETHQLWIGLDLCRLGTEGVRLERALRRDKVRLLPLCNDLEPILRAIIRQIMTPLPLQKRVIVGYLRMLALLVGQHLERRGTVPGNSNVPYSDAVQKAISYMERHLERRIPLSELIAVAAARHVTHFCAQFRREVGTTPAAYHLNLRMTAARRDMLESRDNLTEIAYRYGFSSSQHFSGKFRLMFGLTPRQFRQNT
jgi:AraC-like DNA-binding protein